MTVAWSLGGRLDPGGLGRRPDRPVVALGFDQLVFYVSASAYEAGLYRKADPAGARANSSIAAGSGGPDRAPGRGRVSAGWG